jgi:hypothetical protein
VGVFRARVTDGGGRAETWRARSADLLGNLVAEMAVGRHAERDVLLAMSQFPESVIQK